MAVDGTAKERKGMRRGGDNRDGIRTYRRTYYVRTTNKQDGAATVLGAIGLPTMYLGYSTDTEMDLGAVVVNRTPRQVRNSLYDWYVEIEYSSEKTAGNLPSGTIEDPRLRPPRTAISFETYQITVPGTLLQTTLPSSNLQYDLGILDPAGEPFDPQPLMDDSRPILTISRYESTYNPAIAVEFMNAVNADPFFGASPRQARMVEISTPGKEYATVGGVDIEYYPVTYRIAFRRETWDVVVLNQGGRYLTKSSTDATAEQASFTDKDGHPFIGLLAANGTALDSRKPPRAMPNGAFAATYTRKRAYKEKYFGLLNLPNQMT